MMHRIVPLALYHTNHHIHSIRYTYMYIGIVKIKKLLRCAFGQVISTNRGYQSTVFVSHTT